MRHHDPRRALALAAIVASLVLVGAGCGKKPVQSPPPAPPTAAAPTPAPSEPPAPPAPTPSAAVSVCANPYFALSQGTRVDYESNAGGKISTYSMTVTEATASSVKLSYDFPASKYTFVQAIVCTGGSVTTNSFMNIAGMNSSMTTETKRVEGELMPKDVHAGSTWSTTYETVLTMQGQAGVMVKPMTVTVTTQNKAVAEESVTVPAGTFTALKVEGTSTSNVVMPGAPATAPTVTTSTQWWVKGIGLVKSTSEGQAGTTTTVATKVTR